MKNWFTASAAAVNAPAVGNGALLIAALWSVAGLLAAGWTFLRPGAASTILLPENQAPLFAIALPLAATSYLLRIFRWHRLIVRLIPGLPLGRSLLAQIAAFGLTVTPARLGEASKLYFVQNGTDVPMARIAPILVVERLVEGASFIILAAGAGALLFPSSQFASDLRWAWIVIPAGVAVLFALSLTPLREKILGRITSRSRVSTMLRDFVAGTWDLVGPWTILEALLFSVAARLCDALVLDTAVRSTGGDLPQLAALFVLGSAGTVGGFSMLPGGVGAVEATMTGLLAQFGIPVATGLGAALVARAMTLWLWVALGLAALVAFPGRLRRSP